MDQIHAPLAPTATSVMDMKVATKLHHLYTPSTDTAEAQGGHSIQASVGHSSKRSTKLSHFNKFGISSAFSCSGPDVSERKSLSFLGRALQ